jgi:KDO2-lipid IV(A) lauroyltransferase
MWAHWILMGCEIAHAPRKIHRSNYHQYVSVHRRQELVHFLLDSRPRLLVSGHFGNFELGGFMTGLLGFPTFTVARSLDNPYLDRYVNRFRGAHGQAILPKQGSSGQVDSLMKSGQILTILGDQYAGPKGCWVDFFGHPTSCHKAIALFTLTAGAPLAVVYARRVGGPLQLEIGLAGLADPRLPGPETQGVVALTEWYNRRLEELIFRSPEQYWWLHRRWRERPGRRGSVKRHAA